ncbi:MAG: AAA family ATPase [Tannerella sp.]|jgi:predicted ATPase|nr:AAA family ATPase [Tannerella sp.]
MDKWIKNISGTIPYTNKTVDIELNGRNLIVTGANGSGKTTFLRKLYEILNVHIDLLRKQEEMKESENDLSFDIPDRLSLFSLYDESKAIIQFFEEKRLSDINPPSHFHKVLFPEIENKRQNPNQKFGNNFEQYLVNLMARQSLAITIDKNQILADNIKTWFTDFENNLKILFEDPNVILKFDTDNHHFTIHQHDKLPFTFQTLSAGYRAIFDIYAELIMRAEYFKIMPKELTGIVFIDEIDSHLHVSLQRIILPFLTQSFPKIQFIVTTHSPFVLMSTPNTVVYDLAKNEPIIEDLSYYTYSAVMEGLWDVKPIAAWVEQKIREIEKTVNSENKDIRQLKILIDEIKGREDGLDSESKTILLLGKQTLLKEERKDV